jgi:hypothetical protein
MYVNKPVLVLFLVLVTLTGCASAPVNEAAAPELQQIAENHGRIFVYRLHGDGDGISSAVRVAGEPVGRASPGSFFYVDLPIGEHEIAAARNSKQTVVVDIEAGAEYFVRVDIWLRATRWTLIPVLVPEETARAQMSGLNFAGQ